MHAAPTAHASMQSQVPMASMYPQMMSTVASNGAQPQLQAYPGWMPGTAAYYPGPSL
jgi:hypothetical protein